MNRRTILVLFLLLVVGGGLLIGFFNIPGAWYEALRKPSFNPPNWLFGPVWTLLYVLIAVAGWRLWQNDRGGAAMKLWWLQLALNFAWSPVFFGAEQIGLALVVILALLLTIFGVIALALGRDRVVAMLFAPYAVWVAFASLLNGSIWLLN